MKNCPNCGAPITSHRCAYCGTMFEGAEIAPLERTRETVHGELDGLQFPIAFITSLEKGYRIDHERCLTRRDHRFTITTPSGVKYGYIVPEHVMSVFPLSEVRGWLRARGEDL